MIRAITYGLLAGNPMHFSPDIGNPSDTATCNANYSLQAATCWKNYPDMKIALNCANDGTQGYACCKGGYMVCRKIGPNGAYREITWLGQSTVSNNCGIDPNDPTHPCMPSCGAFQDDGIFNRRKDESPSLSLAPSSQGATDTVSISSASATIQPEARPAPQQR
jgi:hypothetical protein